MCVGVEEPKSDPEIAKRYTRDFCSLNSLLYYMYYSLMLFVNGNFPFVLIKILEMNLSSCKIYKGHCASLEFQLSHKFRIKFITDIIMNTTLT